MTSSTIKGVNDISKELSSQANSSTAKSAIKWDAYNYPPLLSVIHYDLSELEGGGRRVVRWAHIHYLLVLVALLMNVLINFVLACGGVPDKGPHVAYAFFNVLILGALGLYGEYASFKGVGLGKSALMNRYLLLALVMMVAEFLFSLLAVVNWNGWLQALKARELNHPLAAFWCWAAVAESSVWTLAYLSGAVAIYHVYQFDRLGPLAFTSKAASRPKGKDKDKPLKSVRLSRV
ncbi:hypothetical protein T492DRAFT_892235 [Pavlovales sp. CCMP2436]|nr:hypothetical protein T492DRAFT_892235 [Pavlovales sp. CCMP2436]